VALACKELEVFAHGLLVVAESEGDLWNGVAHI
jgi:hypothetical protein